MLECKNPPPVLVNAPPPLLHACQLSAPWALARTITVYDEIIIFCVTLFTDLLVKVFDEARKTKTQPHNSHAEKIRVP